MYHHRLLKEIGDAEPALLQIFETYMGKLRTRGHIGRIWIKKWSRWQELAMTAFYTVPNPAIVTT